MPPCREHTVYVLANRNRTVFYTGVTNDLARRMREHRTAPSGFVQEYRLHALVYAETHADPRDAIRREKQIKRWRREWKLDLVRSVNPAMRDLWTDGVRPW